MVIAFWAWAGPGIKMAAATPASDIQALIREECFIGQTNRRGSELFDVVAIVGSHRGIGALVELSICTAQGFKLQGIDYLEKGSLPEMHQGLG